MTSILVALYVIGGALEFIGLALVAIDIRDAERRAREIPERPISPTFGGTQISSPGSWGAIMRRPDPTPALIQELQSQRMLLIATIKNLQIAIVQTRQDLIHVLVGNVRRRKWGLYALLTGVIVSAAANIISAQR